MHKLLGAVSLMRENQALQKITHAINSRRYIVERPCGIFVSNSPIIELNEFCITGIIRWVAFNSETSTPDYTIPNESWLRFFLKHWIEHNCGLSDQIDGEFACVIWSLSTQEVWGIRDIFGSEPLHYFTDKNCFAFATEAKALWTIPPTPPRINEERILDFIIDDLEHADQKSTFKQGIYKTPIGSISRWKQGVIQSNQYWNPRFTGEFKQDSSQSILEQFQSHLSHAIQKRLLPNQSSGLTLSGGLDSNTILACWNATNQQTKNQERHLFSLIPEKGHRSDPESRMLRSQKGTHGKLPHHWITPSEALEMIGPAEEFVRGLEDPFAIHTLSGPAPCFRHASNLGINQILDGIDGDMVGGIPSKYWYFLWRQGQHVSSLKECFANHQHEEESILLALVEISKLILGSLFPPLKAWNQKRKAPDETIRNEVNHLIADLSIHTKTFNEARIENRLKLLKSNHHPIAPTTIEQSIVNGLKSPMLGVAVDRYRLAADACNIRTIHPLFDRSLVEFLLQLPWKYRVQNGAPKHLFRMVLRNNGQHQLSNQRELGHVGPWFTHQFSKDYFIRYPSPKPESLDALSRYVKIDPIQEAWHASKQKTSINDLDEYIWRLIMLSEWLIENH